MAFTSRVTARVLSVVILRGYATKVNSMKALKKAPSKKPAATQQKVTMATTCTPTGVKSPKRSPKAKPVTTAKVGKVKKIAQSKAEKKPAEKKFSPYRIFAKDQVPTVTGATMAEKVKAVRTLWKALPKVEKAKYITRSQGEEGLKKRLISGFQVYIKENFARAKDLVTLVKEWKELPAPQRQVFIDRARHGEGAKVVKNRKAVRKISGYAVYAKENYAKFQGTMQERAKSLGENWKKMTTEEKAKYQSQAAAPTQPPAKRALSGYVLFVKEKMSGLKGNVAGQIKQAAVEWKAMTAEKQNEYKLKAKAL